MSRRLSGISLARAEYGLGLPETGRQPHPQDPSISLGTLIERRAFYSRRWLDSKAYKVYLDIFRNAILQSKQLHIHQAMCLGLGSLSDVDRPGRTSTHESGMMQLVVFESCIELLREEFDIKKIYLHDPAFTDLDNDFLETHGFIVRKSPEPETLVTNGTFLYLSRVEQVEINACLSRASPALLVTVGDLGRHHRLYRTRAQIKDLLEYDQEAEPNFKKLQIRPDEAYEIRLKFMNNRAVRYRPIKFDEVEDESIAIYWVPSTPSECSNYQREYPEYLSADEAQEYWDELQSKQEQGC